MRRLLATLFLSTAFSCRADAPVDFINGLSVRIQTNAAAIGGSTGFTAAVSNTFHYALFIAPPAVTNISLSLHELLTPTWYFTGLYATNQSINPGGSAGRLLGGINIPAPGWPDNQKMSFIVVGWSTNLGSDWPTLAGELQSATFDGSRWTGPNWRPSDNNLPFFGATDVGWEYGASAGGPPVELFASSITQVDANFHPIITPTTLWVVVPEPSFLFLPAVAILLLKKRARPPRSDQNLVTPVGQVSSPLKAPVG